MELTHEMKIRILQEVARNTEIDDNGNKVPKRLFYYQIAEFCDPVLLKT